MDWVTTVVDIKDLKNGNYLALIGADKNDFFASTVATINPEEKNLIVQIEIPLTPNIWTSMETECAGYDLVLTGERGPYHTWLNKKISEHRLNFSSSGGRLWKESKDKVLYCGSNNIYSIKSNDVLVENLKDTPKLSRIHGIHSQFRVVGGDKGYLAVDRGNGWSRVEDVPTLDNIVDVFCVSESEIYICAGTGGVFRWNGDSDWLQYVVDPEAFMYNLCRHKGKMCVASLHLKSYWLENAKAEPIPESKIATRFSSTEETLFGLGAYGKFEKFDGKKWQIFELDLYKFFPKELEALYAAAPDS